VYLPLAAFARLNEQRAEAGEPTFANPRNSAAGSIRQLDPTVTAARDLSMWAYSIGAHEGIAFATQLESMDLDTMLNDLPGRWQAGFAAQGRSLDVQQQATPPARASAPAVRQILDVLIDNALRHGRGTVIVLRRSSADGAIAIDVTDEGTTGGVALFGAGLGATTMPATAGHLGLALAASLAEAQGGRLLHARTEPTTRVSLLLPAVTDER